MNARNTNSRITALRKRHAALEAQLEAALNRPMPDLIEIRGLKQRKLRLKDAIALIEREAAHSITINARTP